MSPADTKSTTRFPGITIDQLGEKVIAGDPITRNEALSLLELNGPDRFELFFWANRIRLACRGSRISLCSIASIRTGRCTEDCRFCAQSSHYKTPVEYAQADDEQVVVSAGRAQRDGAGNFGLVSSGQRPNEEQISRVGTLARKISLNTGIQTCAALGCLTDSQARQLFEMGIRRYNHNLETSQRYFNRIVTTHRWEDRVNTVRAAQRAGMKVCCGGIIGMGESLEDRVDLALALRELHVDCAPVNFLMPIPGTPLEGEKPLTPLEALQTVAMYRFVLPNSDIKIAGGREGCLRELQSWIFFAGASSLMIGNYLTTQGRPARQDLQMLADLEVPVREEYEKEKAEVKPPTLLRERV
jgi:biotin synthase